VGIPDEKWVPLREYVGDGVPDEAWAAIQQDCPPGTLVSGRVLAHLPMGYFLALPGGNVGQVEIVSIREQGVPVSEADYPAVGTEIEAVVVQFVPHNRQVRLSTRPSDLRGVVAE
jgi:ribosomal protein S1